jgi:hypothetical protein
MAKRDPKPDDVTSGRPEITTDTADKLVRTAEEHAQGALSDDEFEAERSGLLDPPSEP